MSHDFEATNVTSIPVTAFVYRKAVLDVKRYILQAYIKRNDLLTYNAMSLY